MAAELEAVHDASVEGTGEMRRCRKMLQEEGAEEGTHLDAAELRSRRPPRSSLSPFLPFLLICSRGGKREVNRYILRDGRFQHNSEPEASVLWADCLRGSDFSLNLVSLPATNLVSSQTGEMKLTNTKSNTSPPMKTSKRSVIGSSSQSQKISVA